MSKSYRLVEIAREVFTASAGTDVTLLDLSRLASEYGRHIHSMQGVLLDSAGFVPLAMLLLSELFARTDPGLDERYLSHVGCGGQLVSSLFAAQADDGRAGLRRRR